MKTKQEEFWQSGFGNDYIKRNRGKDLLASNISFFSRVLQSASQINSILELGCNVGMNLKAIDKLLPKCSLTGVEINPVAANELRIWRRVTVIEESLLEIQIDEKYDLTFTKGVLIHISPDYLEKAYEQLYVLSNKYILIGEYYNPTPVSLSYRGHKDKLFKRDFAGELIDKYPNLKLVDYGFVYHRDPSFPQDDISWFLLTKT